MEVFVKKELYFIFILLFFLTSITLYSEVNAKMFKYPDVSDKHICFVYAGDIWVVDKVGGIANKLSSPKGTETFPRFSPDGSKIAFSGNYDGNTDVYILPVFGGTPVRKTYHPMSDRFIDWTPKGKELIFASSRESGRQRFNQLYHIGVKKGFPEKYPVAYGEFAAISPDKRVLAFMPETRDFRNWKRYRGGGTSDIWLFNLNTYESTNMSSSNAIDGHPMWYKNFIYFLSDRGKNQRQNIWKYNTVKKSYKQVTFFKDFDITFPAIGPENIVFEAGGNIYLMELPSENYRQIKIDVVSDLSLLKPKKIDAKQYLRGATISNNGNRIIVEARGELFSIPAEKGFIKNLTQTPGIAEIKPSFSPDEHKVVYWSDAEGEYNLYIKNLKDAKTATKLTSFENGFRYNIFWSPDSKKLSFIDNLEYIYIYNLENDSLEKIDREIDRTHPGLNNFKINWSPDSKWLLYNKNLSTGQTAVFIYSLEKNKAYQLTSGFYNDFSPVFDPESKYIYLLSNRSLNPVYSSIDETWIYPNTTKIVAVPLTGDIDSLLKPRNDEEKIKSKDEENKKEHKEKKDSEQKDIVIEIKNFERRMIVLPVKAGRYSDLGAVKGKVIYRKIPNSGSGSRISPIKYYDIKKREEKTILPDADEYKITGNGKKLLVLNRGKLYIVKILPKQKLGEPVPVDNLYMIYNPKAEWKQIFNDVWRRYRDFFYDPNMHGLNWEQVRNKYSELLKDAVSRSDVNFVIGDMIAEVNSSHTYVFGGDRERPGRKNVGLLGIDWKLENGAYKIKRIIKGAEWDHQVRSPLDEPGIKIEEGDYILAVNGRPIKKDKEPWSAFVGLAGKTVSLTINDKPSLENAREIIVKTLRSETRLRNLDWINQNRKYVENLSDGKLGYIYMPNTSYSGQTELIRQFYGQLNKKGFIVDERFNSGGQLSDRFIELLTRPVVHYISRRNGPNWQQPTYAHEGPKVMLINGWSVSGGDAFPYVFKSLKVGPIVGTRTAGGLIGPATGHFLIDGGAITVPGGRIFSVNGEWFPEGHGIEPDYKVDDNPTKLAKGIDPQIKKAVEVALELLKKNPPQKVEHPPFEDRIPEKLKN